MAKAKVIHFGLEKKNRELRQEAEEQGFDFGFQLEIKESKPRKAKRPKKAAKKS